MIPNPPPSFLSMCNYFIQDIDIFPNVEKMIDFCVGDITHADAFGLLDYIDVLLSLDLKDGELVDFWWSTPAQTVFMNDESVVYFLTELRKFLHNGPLKSG
jgi:hypothetical protein